MLTTYAANHSVKPAINLPARMARRDTGVTSRLSNVSRSRSPLIPSAVTTRVSSTPTPTTNCRTRFTASRRSRKFRAELVEAR
jgi:hypothetical protein